ncbi:hypothetical protein C8F04DRAFT_1187878 [Mycena alexandri]|uniref:DUF6533 domain-containing protein n=1 Tax=Mycena alexandri TaxID=1745969 RepID=A0AAD6WXU3_9AGAR|nr:hypothetical protein C8F04DRAFT_1187878 [Mycena alexandri]
MADTLSEEAISALRLQVVKLFDYALTFHLEVDLIWPSAWSPAKILFVSARYTPFFDVPMQLYWVLAVVMSASRFNCKNVFQGWISNRLSPRHLRHFVTSRSAVKLRDFDGNRCKFFVSLHSGLVERQLSGTSQSDSNQHVAEMAG